MNPDQAPNARRTLKRAYDANSDDAHSGDTPAAKRNKPRPDPESESDGTPTPSKPTKPTMARVKPIQPHLKGKKRMAHNTPSPPRSMPPPATPNFSRDITVDITPDVISPTCEGLPPAAFAEMSTPTGDPTDPADASSPLDFPSSPTKESETDTADMEMETESPPPAEPSEDGPEGRGRPCRCLLHLGLRARDPLPLHRPPKTIWGMAHREKRPSPSGPGSPIG